MKPNKTFSSWAKNIMNAQANYYNKLWSLQNFKSVIYAFCKGFADSLKFSDIFFLDSMDQQKNLEKQIEKDQRKERLLHHRGDSPGPSSDNLAKKRYSDPKMRIPSGNYSGKPKPVLNSIWYIDVGYG